MEGKGKLIGTSFSKVCCCCLLKCLLGEGVLVELQLVKRLAGMACFFATQCSVMCHFII